MVYGLRTSVHQETQSSVGRSMQIPHFMAYLRRKKPKEASTLKIMGIGLCHDFSNMAGWPYRKDHKSPVNFQLSQLITTLCSKNSIFIFQHNSSFLYWSRHLDHLQEDSCAWLTNEARSQKSPKVISNLWWWSVDCFLRLHSWKIFYQLRTTEVYMYHSSKIVAPKFIL